ncbi:MAG: transposase [Saprospiraceae bacterium]|nr:transposase [Saprospiraceae bacterium]
MWSFDLKHIYDLSDRDSITAILKNIKMQFFIGYSSFNSEPPFNPSLFCRLTSKA